MKRFPLLVLWLLASAPGFAAERVRATYRSMDGRSVQAEWLVTREGNVVRFQLGGQDRATAYLENGRVMKLILRKRHAGKWKDMVITAPAAIAIQLRSAFYPFGLLREDAQQPVRWTSGASMFERVAEAVPQ